MLLSVVCVILLICIAIIAKRRRQYVRLVDKIGGPKGSSVLGNVSTLGVFKKDSPNVPQLAIVLERFHALRVYSKDGLVRIWLGVRPFVFIYNYKAAENLFASNSQVGKAYSYEHLKPWLGTGLITSGGMKWKTRRKLLTPAFHFRILEDALSVINEKSKIFLDNLETATNKDWINIVPYITKYTLDIICETAMGINLDVQKNQESLYEKNLHQVSKTIVERSVRPWLWVDAIFRRSPVGKEFYASLKYVHDFTRKVIQERKASFVNNESNTNDRKTDHDEMDVITKKKRLAFLDIVLNQHMKDSSFGEEDIREEVDTFMFAGHDTTAMGLSWSMYLIGLYPQVQKKIWDELETIFGDDSERNVTEDDLKKMKYLECVMKESHRLYPPVPYIGRYFTEDTVINGLTVPKGVEAFILLVAIHRDPTVFPNPEVFDPDRFFIENASGRNSFSYVPFSAGPRNCIGQRFALMEEKITLANVLRRFTLQSLDPRDKMITSAEVVLRPVGGIRSRIRRRRIEKTCDA